MIRNSIKLKLDINMKTVVVLTHFFLFWVSAV